MSPRPRTDIVADALELPSYEEQLREMAHYIDSQTHGGQYAIIVMPTMSRRIVASLRAFADRVEGDA